MTEQTAPPTSLTRAERLDRLRFGKGHGKLLLGSGIGWALDAMDVGLIAFVMAALTVQWQLDQTTVSIIGSIGFVGMAIGASLAGLLADRIGRRQVFALTLLVYGLATGAAALSTGVGMLIALRFIVGLGLGGELPVASTLVSEYAPRKVRGRVVVALEAFWAVGWLAAALIGYFIVPVSADGWRWALAAGVLPTVYAIVVRFGLPESVRFLESKGRFAEAEAAVQKFERAVDVEPVPSPDVIPTPPTGGEGIWSPTLRMRTAALWAVWFCINLSYYGAFTWIPTLLVGRGFTLTKSFEFTLYITLAQLPGYLVAAILIEIWGRRATLATFMLGSAVGAALYGLAAAPWQIIAAGCVLSFFNLGAWGALYAVGPEIYPTNVRGTGTGAAAAFGRIASVIAPLIVPPLILVGGPLLVFGVFGAAFTIGAGAALLLPERKDVALDVEPES